MGLNIGLIGYGYWGTNLLRNLIESSSVSQVAVCDIRNERIQIINKMYPDILTTNDANDLINDPEIDAIVIATPTTKHYDLAKASLLQGKHVLVEKPLCNSSSQAAELVELAHRQKLVLLTDHTFLYNGAVRLIHENIQSGKVGKLKYIDSTRINLGIYQQDTNVIWDLASHDISIVQLLVDEQPSHIRAIGQYNSIHKKEDLAYIFLHYPSDLLVQINCSWASPAKIRQIIIGGEKQMVIFDDIEPSHKVKIYDFKAIESTDEDRKKVLIDYRLGDIHIPKFSTEEPLRCMVEDFFNCIRTGGTPFSSPERALDIVRIIEKAETSLYNHGALIEL